MKLCASLFCATFLAILSPSYVAFAAATRICPDGSTSHPATREEAAAAPGGIVEGETQLCPGDATYGINADVGQAKLELNHMWCSGHPTLACGQYRSTVEDLSGQFAVCIVDFIKKYRQRDPGLCITSAYRSTEHQRCICGDGGEACAAPGRSNHQKGIAVDFRASNYDDMHAAVRAYPGLRHLTIASDPYHVEADSSGKCGTGTAGPNTGPQQQSPFQNAMNAIRSFFSPPPPPPIVPPAPINPVYDPSQYFSTTSPSATSSNFVDTTTYPTTSPKSVVDLIEAIAVVPPPSSSTTTATGTRVELIGAIGNVAGLRPGEKPLGTATGTLVVSSLTPSNTFISQDLSKTPTGNILRGNSTFVLLEGLRQVLLKLLSVLRPFGGRTNRPSIHAAMPPDLAE